MFCFMIITSITITIAITTIIIIIIIITSITCRFPNRAASVSGGCGRWAASGRAI